MNNSDNMFFHVLSHRKRGLLVMFFIMLCFALFPIHAYADEPDGEGKIILQLVYTPEELNAYQQTMGEEVWVYLNSNTFNKVYRLPLTKEQDYTATFDVPAVSYQVIQNPNATEPTYEILSSEEEFLVKPSETTLVSLSIVPPDYNAPTENFAPEGGSSIKTEGNQEQNTTDNGNTSVSQGAVEPIGGNGQATVPEGNYSGEEQAAEEEKSGGFHLTLGNYVTIGCVIAIIGLFVYHKIRG